MAEKEFKPAFQIVSGRLWKTEKEYGIEFWDDRDPRYTGRKGDAASYIFRKTRPCKIKLGKMKIQKYGDTFHLIDEGKKVAVAIINYFHRSYADVEIETLESHRRKGYATILFGWISDWLTEQGFIHESTCDIKNEASLKMHQKLGFEIVGYIRWRMKE